MKVEFTNPERTEAILVRGWWSKKIANVFKDPKDGWCYSGNGYTLDYEERHAMEYAEARAIHEAREANWFPTPPLPRARLLR